MGLTLKIILGSPEAACGFVPKAASNFFSGFPLLSLVDLFYIAYTHSRLSENFLESRHLLKPEQGL